MNLIEQLLVQADDRPDDDYNVYVYVEAGGVLPGQFTSLFQEPDEVFRNIEAPSGGLEDQHCWMNVNYKTYDQIRLLAEQLGLTSSKEAGHPDYS